MSKNYEIRLEDTVLFNITVSLIEAVGREAKKMLQLSCAAYNDFLKPKQYSTGLISVAGSSKPANTAQSSSQNRHKPFAKPKDIEIARFVELKAQNLGYQSHGIKLLPEKTGEIIEFTFESPKEKVKNIYKKEVYREAKSVC